LVRTKMKDEEGSRKPIGAATPLPIRLREGLQPHERRGASSDGGALTGEDL